MTRGWVLLAFMSQELVFRVPMSLIINLTKVNKIDLLQLFELHSLHSLNSLAWIECYWFINLVMVPVCAVSSKTLLIDWCIVQQLRLQCTIVRSYDDDGQCGVSFFTEVLVAGLQARNSVHHGTWEVCDSNPRDWSSSSSRFPGWSPLSTWTSQAHPIADPARQKHWQPWRTIHALCWQVDR